MKHFPVKFMRETDCDCLENIKPCELTPTKEYVKWLQCKIASHELARIYENETGLIHYEVVTKYGRTITIPTVKYGEWLENYLGRNYLERLEDNPKGLEKWQMI